MFDPSKCTRDGSINVLVDAYYTDRVTAKVKTGPKAGELWDYFFLLLLFGHKSKEGKVTTRFRRIKLLANPIEEFKIFWRAYFGYDCLLTEPLDFKVFTDSLIQDIRENTYNFRILFGEREMLSIQREEEMRQIRLPGMIWPDKAIEMYPTLKENNKIFENYYRLRESKVAV